MEGSPVQLTHLSHSRITDSWMLSSDVAARCLDDLQDALKAVRRKRMPDLDSVAWPAGLDRSILKELPLKRRTDNCLRNAELIEGDNALTVAQLLCLRNFGHTSLSDLLYNVERVLRECIDAASPSSPLASAQSDKARNTTHEAAVPTTAAEAPPLPWESAGQVLNPLLAAAAELRGARTLAAALKPELMDLAASMGLADAVGAIGIEAVTDGTLGPVSATVRRLAVFLEATSESERTIIKHRLLQHPPNTLEEVGGRVGVTRERVRQVQARIESSVGDVLGRAVRITASTLKFGHIVAVNEVERRIAALLPTGPEFANRLFRHVLIDEMGLTLVHGVYVDKRAREVVEDIRAQARRIADDVGLVNAQELIATLPGEEWRQFWPWLCERCEFHDLFGSCGTRDTRKARVKAALISVGRPTTREEIARMCGFDERKTSSLLSAIPSVVRADKDRWGLREWIDDEYDGIIDEIIQRIEEDGGATTTERLLTELPSKFGVSPMSVRAYMQTPKFVVRDGWISLANAASLQLRELDDVIDGREPDGNPYWSFLVEARFFDGYSLPGVPPEFAKALGCDADGERHIQIENAPECRELTIRWRLGSTTGAWLGYVGGPLRRLGLQPGERARVTIKKPGVVELHADDGIREERQPTEADAILERMIGRRRAL